MIRTLAALSLLMLAPAALASDPQDGGLHPGVGLAGVYGDWITQGGSAVVRIAACEDAAVADTPCGTVLSADIPEGAPTTDVNNADPALRDQPIVGITMLDGFEASKSGKWKSGRIYNPEDGKSYKSSIEVRPEEPHILRVKGCIAFLCQTQEWTRVGS